MSERLYNLKLAKKALDVSRTYGVDMEALKGCQTEVEMDDLAATSIDGQIAEEESARAEALYQPEATEPEEESKYDSLISTGGGGSESEILARVRGNPRERDRFLRDPVKYMARGGR